MIAKPRRGLAMLRSRGRAAALLLLGVVAVLPGCAGRPPVEVEARGGNRSGIDWRLGIPF
ncbi:hypothetical protein [Arenibaculum pallidiluteum]|uniref:hypothetical protein n=1 Tax=Arenibaculum pallidiluteum TaxID=2812559 RepID=UPI001A96B05F|nr:hypothetical protein [Arenibaculum pallidiluteum]